MRMVMIVGMLAGAIAAGLPAQRLETQQLDPSQVMRVETARDHLTVIEVADPVTMVAVGNPNAFNVERRENKVFIKPVQDDARTNLFIWTATGRYAYELAPAAGLEQMHFAVDQPPAVTRTSLGNEMHEQVPKTPALPMEMLTDGTPILVEGRRGTDHRVEVTLRDLYRDAERIYIRYALLNKSATPYQPVEPAVWQLSGVRSPTSLIGASNRQLGERLVKKLKWNGSTPVEVVNAGQSQYVDPHGQGLGWVILDGSEVGTNELPILRMRFAADRRGAVEAVLVLNESTERREVADAHAHTAAGDQ
ncbi:MAG: TrbG/VirB9 family P-type conjugative transfer protein [Bryobacteraceae bacterium]|nr:TrbG/VirB9 family P-type conjugative transfer protein [Bryobacteraceae bacterium]